MQPFRPRHGAAVLCLALLPLAAPAPASAQTTSVIDVYFRVLPDTRGRGFELRLRGLPDGYDPRELADRRAEGWCDGIYGTQATFSWTAKPVTHSLGWDRAALCEPNQ